MFTEFQNEISVDSMYRSFDAVGARNMYAFGFTTYNFDAEFVCLFAADGATHIAKQCGENAGFGNEITQLSIGESRSVIRRNGDHELWTRIW